MNNSVSIEKDVNSSFDLKPHISFWGSVARRCTSAISDLDPLWQFTISQLIMNKAGGSIRSKHMLLCAGIIAFMVIEELL
jgi:hypothetical protein